MNHFFKKRCKSILVIISVILIISISYHIYKFNFKYEDKVISKVSIISLESISDSSIVYLARVEEGIFNDHVLLKIYLDEDDSYISLNKEEMFFNRFSNYEYNDVIYVNRKLDKNNALNNMYEFDYNKYLNSRNIVGSISVNEVKYITTNNNILTPLYEYLNKFKEYIEYTINDDFGLFKTIILGDKIDFEDKEEELFTIISLNVFISVSGSNLYIIKCIIDFISNMLNKCINNINSKYNIRKIVNLLKINNVIKILSYIIFYIFCNFKISILRVLISYILVEIFTISNSRVNRYIKLIITTLILLIYNPYIIFSLSFLLGTVATLGIYIINSNLNKYLMFNFITANNYYKYIYHKSSKTNKVLKLVNSLKQYIIKSTSIYLSSLISLFPLIIYYFNYYSIISYLGNILLFPIYLLKLILGTILIITFKIPILADIIVIIDKFIIDVLKFILNIFENINISFSLHSPTSTTIIIYYIVLLLIVFKDKIINYLIHNRLILKYTNSYLKSYKKKRVVIKHLVIIARYILIVIILINYFVLEINKTYIYYFNVGQGNMALISHNNKVIMFDIGSISSNVKYPLETFLTKKNIYIIDYLIISHFHTDHYNGLYELEESLSSGNIVIKNIIYSYIENEEFNYTEFEKFIQKYNINKIMVESYDNIQIDNEISLDFIYAPSETIIKSDDLINTNSIVTLLTLNNSYHLFMGDATIETEEHIMKEFVNKEANDEIIYKLNNLDTYQVGHHGSKTSSSEEFLKFIYSNNYIISSKKSIFNHPSTEILNRFSTLNLHYTITESNGYVYYEY